MAVRRAAVWIIAVATVLCGSLAARAARVGERAPDFSVSDTNGKVEKLSD
jgi:hypothetical protein